MDKAATPKPSLGTVERQYYTFGSADDPFRLVCGKHLQEVTVAYETYGDPANRSRTVLVAHALTGDAHAAGRHRPGDRKPGWWDEMIGPGKTFDTNRFFIVCSNVLGGCQGSTGPSSIDPATGHPYGRNFPPITVKDMVRVQYRLLRHLGVDSLFCVAGGSMGGMQALQWAVEYPDFVSSVIPIATTARHSPQTIAFYEVGRQAIITDPNWNNGNYYGGEPPKHGLSVARMIAHITYLSEESMLEKFGRNLQPQQKEGGKHEFQVESYLHYQGSSFVERFDANSYLILTRALDHFDLTQGKQSLAEAFFETRAKFLLVSFSSDWHYTPGETKAIAKALRLNDVDVSYSEIKSNRGHDAFLIEHEKLGYLIRGFLNHLDKELEGK